MHRAVLMAVVLMAAGFGCGSKSQVNTLPQNDPVFAKMWTLATMAEDLDVVMHEEPVSQDKAVALLERMEKVTIELKGDEHKHPVLLDNMDAFYNEVAVALKAARVSPPNYYYAGKVSGACVYCHDPRGGVRPR